MTQEQRTIWAIETLPPEQLAKILVAKVMAMNDGWGEMLVDAAIDWCRLHPPTRGDMEIKPTVMGMPYRDVATDEKHEVTPF